MRAIVVGCGGVGAMAAWRLARAGVRVTALEQFRIEHDRGSSYGDSRIVRRVYPDALYTGLMADAYDLWELFQARFPDRELFVKCGGLYLGPADNALVKAASDALAESGVPFERLTADETMRRYPAFRLTGSEMALFEPSMGYARASACVRSALELACEAGAEVREETTVERVGRQPGGGVIVTLQTGETLTADRAIVTVGPWLSPLARSLGATPQLTVTRQPYVHLAPERNPELFAVGSFPTWIDAEANTYGFPVLGDQPGVKIGLHDRGEATTPETVDRRVNDADRDGARRYAAGRFPWLGRNVVYEKVCLYTNTPTEDFIVDSAPAVPDVLLIGGLSGHGFKFTPLLGDIAARWALGESPTHPLQRFALSRIQDRGSADEI